MSLRWYIINVCHSKEQPINNKSSNNDLLSYDLILYLFVDFIFRKAYPSKINHMWFDKTGAYFYLTR